MTVTTRKTFCRICEAFCGLELDVEVEVEQARDLEHLLEGREDAAREVGSESVEAAIPLCI